MDDKIKSCPKKSLYYAILEDGTKFRGGTDYNYTKWDELPNKKIKHIFYKLPNGDYLCLENYDAYFHMVEATQDWMRMKRNKLKKIEGKPRIEYVYIMGRFGDEVTSYKIVLFNRKHKVITLVLKNEKEEKIITCGVKNNFYFRNKRKIAQNLKIHDKVSIYNYAKQRIEEFKIIDKIEKVQSDKYKVGDMTVRKFNTSDDFIRKLNPMGWR